MEHSICIFESLYKVEPIDQSLHSFPDLIELLSSPIIAQTKGLLPLFAPVKLKNSHTTIANDAVESLSLLVLDIDGLPLDEFVDKIANYNHIVYNTHSSFATEDKDKDEDEGIKGVGGISTKIGKEPGKYWRVILQAVGLNVSSQSHLKSIVKSLAMPLKTATQGGVDTSCFDLARRYFLPAIPSEDHLEDFTFIAEADKQPLDIDSLLTQARADAKIPLSTVRAETTKVVPKNPLSTLSVSTSNFEPGEAVPAGMRHETMLKAATYILFNMRADSSFEAFKSQVFEYDAKHCAPPMSDPSKPSDNRELERIISDVWAKFEDCRGSEQEVEKKVMESEEIKELIVSYIEALNEIYAYVTKEQRIWRFKHSDFITWQAFFYETSNYNVEIRLKKSKKILYMSKQWADSKLRRTHKTVAFEPGECEIIAESDCINLWRGWGVTPQKSDTLAAPFVALMQYIFGDDKEAMEWFLKWVAYPIQNPGAKMFSAVLLWGKHGTGKTLTGEIIGKIYGHSYKNIETRMLHSDFTGWRRDLQFVCGDEISTHENKRQQNDALKHLITGSTIHINEKFQPVYTLRNCANFLFTSNHPNAIALEQTERRFFVWEMPDKINKETLKKAAECYLNQGGASALMYYFLHEVDTSGFDPTNEPLRTLATEDMMDSAKSDLESFLADLKLNGIDGTIIKSEIVTPADLKTAYALNNTHTTYPAIKNALYRIGIQNKHRRELKYIDKKGRRKSMRFIPITNIEYWHEKDNDAWRDEYEKKFG